MRINKISVKNLFDYYCYDINFKKNNNISLLHAPNGYGKTTIFNLIKYYLDIDIINILIIPFEEFVIELSDGIVLKIVKNDETKNNYFIKNICFIIIDNGDVTDFSLELSPRDISLIKNEGIRDFLRRVDFKRRHLNKENRLENSLYNTYYIFFNKLSEIKNVLSVNYINSNRLYFNKHNFLLQKPIFDDDYENQYDDINDENLDNDNAIENIIEDAKDIYHQIQVARQKYSLESERRDRDFPARLVEFVEKSETYLNVEQISEELKKLENKRVELEKAGLILSGKNTLTPSNNIDQTMQKFYSLYIQDTFEKLQVYDEIKRKLELFLYIINSSMPFSNKKMSIDNENGVIFKSIHSKSGKENVIPLHKLSSGEKHNFIMFYELIFNSDNISVVLIDEPEISLHITWQTQYINMLKKICDQTGIQAIIATHSPDIVNGNDDLLVSMELKDETKNV